MRALCSLVFVLVTCLAAAQDVKEVDSLSSPLREVRREAKKQNLDWPSFSDGGTGTYLFFTSDKNNADLTVVSTLKLDDALGKLKEAAIALGLPETDFLVRSGSISSLVDMEFNDAITTTKTSGSFVFEVRRFIEEIEKRGFPQPIRVAFRGGVEMAELRGSEGNKALEGRWTLMSKEEAIKWETFHVSDSAASWSPIAGWGLLFFFGGCYIGIYASLGKLVYKNFKSLNEKSSVSPAPLTPQEIQSRYDEVAKAPWWKKASASWPFLILTPVILLSAFNVDLMPFLNQAYYGLPFPLFDYLSPKLMVWLFAPFLLAVPFLIFQLNKVRKIKEARGEVTAQEKIDNAMMSRLTPMMAALGAMSLLLLITMAFPGLFSVLPRPFRFLPILIIAGAGFVWTGIAYYKTRNAEKLQDVGEDEFVFREAQAIGSRAGVLIKKVQMKESESANAWATLFGTVGVTSKLKDNFSEDEIRAILAHEVGHLKGMDVPRLFWMSLGLLAVFLGLVFWLGSMNNPLGRIVSSFTVIINLFVLPLILGFLMAPARHKAELAADRFAVEVTGDLDLVARTLIKIHDVNHSPHKLTEWDERMASHPALTTRLKKLYESQGMTPPGA